ncbi:hypothetical protein KY343_03155 [Candidatus Woesearchaeota archaeon]|nr:hypothetical protein [Candidatus Woesearchaeota archaeon]
MKDIDYVKLYAEKLKSNPDLFKQQKMLIESQLHASSSLFNNMFAGKNFKENARKYLKNVGLTK